MTGCRNSLDKSQHRMDVVSFDRRCINAEYFQSKFLHENLVFFFNHIIFNLI